MLPRNDESIGENETKMLTSKFKNNKLRSPGGRSLLLMTLCLEGPSPFRITFGGSPLVLRDYLVV